MISALPDSKTGIECAGGCLLEYRPLLHAGLRFLRAGGAVVPASAPIIASIEPRPNVDKALAECGSGDG
jgi:hypothetical protein